MCFLGWRYVCIYTGSRSASGRKVRSLLNSSKLSLPKGGKEGSQISQTLDSTSNDKCVQRPAGHFTLHCLGLITVGYTVLSTNILHPELLCFYQHSYYIIFFDVHTDYTKLSGHLVLLTVWN